MENYSLNLVLKVKTESNNVLLRTNKFKRNLGNKEIYDLIRYKTIGKRPIRPLTNYKLVIIRHYWKALDYDNLVSSMKAYVDGLTKAGIIEDDKWIFSGPWEVSQKIREKSLGPLLEIQVFESREIKKWKN